MSANGGAVWAVTICSWQVKDIYYIFIMDACRETLDGQVCDQGFSATLDPRYRNPSDAGEAREKEMMWAWCTGTNRDSKAYDGDAGRLNFTRHLLSDDCGLFEPNVPLRTAIELACSRAKRAPAQVWGGNVDITKQEPVFLLGNIPKDFCFREEPGSAERFDVCVCYRRDTDSDKANFVVESMLDCRVFHSPIPGRVEPPAIQTAKAVCNSSLILVVISGRTFDGINGDIPQAGSGVPLTKRQQELADFLVQLELILERVEHHGSSVAVLPVYLGDERQESVSWKTVLPEVDGEACWPGVEEAKEKSWALHVRSSTCDTHGSSISWSLNPAARALFRGLCALSGLFC